MRIFCKTEEEKKLKMVSLVFFYILQLPHTVISNSEKLTHPKIYKYIYIYIYIQCAPASLRSGYCIQCTLYEYIQYRYG